MDNGNSDVNNGSSPMRSLEARIKSFRNTTFIDGKKYRWPYTVIPYEDMARLGFFYNPYKDYEKDGEVCRDAVQCVYCKHTTHDFKECRSKKKDTTETMVNVLRQHLATIEGTCLLADLKLRVLQDVQSEFESIKWEEIPVFCDPLGQLATSLRRFTFEMNWNLNHDTLSGQKMSEAGLLRYDSSFTGFEDLAETEVRDACYCVYCKRLVGSWQPNDDPLLEHFKSCNGGKCFFFKTMREDVHFSTTLQNLENKYADVSVDEPYHATGNWVGSQDFSSPKSKVEDEDKEDDNVLASRGSPLPREKNEEPSSPIKSPARKKRLLRKSTTKRYFEEDTSNISEAGIDVDKDLVVEFKEHVEKARNIGRMNKILDDSSDEFSFSAQGHSTFEIPAISALAPTSNFEKVDENTEEDSKEPQGAKTSFDEPSNDVSDSKIRTGHLNTIPIDGSLSPDTPLKTSVASTPIHSPQSAANETFKAVNQFPEEIQRLRHLQRKKAH